jgi:hypothetical protein
MKAMYSRLVAALTVAWTAMASCADALFVDAKTVVQVQKTLNNRGFRTGGIDGKMGPQTQAALVNFKRNPGRIHQDRAESVPEIRGHRRHRPPQPPHPRPSRHYPAVSFSRQLPALKHPAPAIREAQRKLSDRGYRPATPTASWAAPPARRSWRSNSSLISAAEKSQTSVSNCQTIRCCHAELAVLRR